MRILFSNMGYARGINGSLWHHTSRALRHLYFSPAAQHLVLRQLKSLIDEGQPDLCCLVEIDRGSRFSGGLNQIEALHDDSYRYFDIADKYSEEGRKSAMQEGRCNAFLSRAELPFERLYLKHGTKRLVYKIQPSPDLTIFFAHFSLKGIVRAAQFAEMRDLVERTPGETMVLADFNIMNGFRELAPLTGDGRMVVLNREDQPTFLFHRRKLALDLCLCTPGLASRAAVTVVPQPFSDHAALLVDTGAP